MNKEDLCEFIDVYQDHESNFEDTMCQGDIFRSDAITFQIQNPESICGWILVNATCDLVRKGKTDFLRFIPIRPLDFFIKENQEQGKRKIQTLLDIIIKYNSLKAFFLPPSTKFGGGKPHYAELGYILSLPVTIDFEELTEQLLKFRLASIKYPWREKLAESLSNSFYRIGVPEPPENWNEWRDLYMDEFFESK